MIRVNVIGDSLVDLIFELPKHYLHKLRQTSKIELPFGEKLSLESYQIFPGGSGANVAMGLSRAGLPTWLYSFIGNDAFASYLREKLKGHNLTLSDHLSVSPTPLSVVLRSGGERTIVTARSEMSFLPEDISEKGWIHIGPLHGNIDDFTARILSHRVKTGQEVSINPSIEAIEERSRGLIALLRDVDIVFLNRKEAFALARLPIRTSVEDLLRAVTRMGPKVVCLTDGEQGAYVYGEGIMLSAQALADRHSRVDATGAGDAFTSGFLSTFLHMRDSFGGEDLLRKSLASAMANSASVVSTPGAQEGLLSRAVMNKDGASARIKRIVL